MSWFVWDPHHLLHCVVASAALHLTGWLICWAFKVRERKVVFPVVYFTIAIVALLTYVLGGANHPRKALVTFLTVAFSVRLGGFIVYRSLNKYQDKKFPVFMWVLMFITPIIFDLPVILCNSPLASGGSLGLVELIGATAGVLGLLIEIVADHQKLMFRQDPRNEGKWCSVGLYKYSRYPNYFGDFCVWWGIFLVCLPTLAGLKWVAVVSPLFETLIILKWDGVPRLEITHEKQYGKNPGYIEYKNYTSTFIPCPPWLYHKLS